MLVLKSEEKRLLLNILAGFLAILIIIVLIVVIWSLVVIGGKDSHDKNKPAAWNSTGWKDAAVMLRDAMNTSADPCEDFYQYSCGKWISDHHPRPPANREGQKTATLHKIITNLSGAFGKIDPTNNSVPEFLRVGKQVLDSCIGNFNQTKYNWVALMRNTTHHELGIGGWPLGEESWSDTNFSLFSSIGLLAARDVNSLMTIEVDADWNNPKEYAVYIHKGKLGLRSPKYYLNKMLKDDVYQYKSKVMRIATILRNFNVTGATGQKLAEDILNLVAFETKLAHAMSSPTLEFARQNNRYNFSRLTDRWPEIKWQEIFKPLLFAEKDKVPKNFIVTSGGYIDQLVGFIRSTPKRVLANYMGWRYIQSLLLYKPAAFSDPPLFPGFTSFLDLGPQNQVTTCFLLMASHMTFVPGYVYNKVHPPPLTAAYNISHIILAALKSEVNSNHWLDSKSLANANQKLDQLTVNLGYPKWIQNVSHINHMYADLISRLKTTGTDNFYDVLQILRKEKKVREFFETDQHVDKGQFTMRPIDFFSKYDNVRNSLTSPAAWMNQPYFNPEFPISMQFGSYGWLVARLMTNALSTDGVQFKSDGQLGYLFTNDVMGEYYSKVRCFSQQYDKYCYGEPLNYLCISGKQTREENIADNVALRVAYRAFKEYRQKVEEPEKPLPGFENYSSDKLFFLAYSNIWCRNELPKAIKDWILIDRYSPARYRVQGSVRNFPKFGNAFGCVNGSPLYPNPKETEICHLF